MKLKKLAKNKRLKKALSNEAKKSANTNHPYATIESVAKALMTWHTHDAFLDGKGLPKPLTAEELQNVFAVAGNLEPRASRAAVKLMQEFGAVALANGQYSPVARSALISKKNRTGKAYVAEATARLAGTLEHNLSAKKPKLFERQLSDVRIKKEDFPIFLSFVKHQGEAFIDAIDDWLSTRQTSDPKKNDFLVAVNAFASVKNLLEEIPATKRRSRLGRPPKAQ